MRTTTGELTLHAAVEDAESCLLENGNPVSVPKARDKVASLNIDRELLASGTVHENLHFLPMCVFL